MSGHWLWILGGGQMQVPSIIEAHALGFRTIVSDQDDHCPCREIAESFKHIDIFDIEGHLEVLKSLTLTVHGVFAAGIDCPETAAAMQEYLVKPTAPRDIARLCHDKKEFRQAMRVLGYPTPAEAEVIVKPRYNSGSRGIRMYSSTNAQSVEELWHGTEHTVETLFDIKGNFHPCFITDRHFDYTDGFALEVGLRHPSVLPRYVQAKAFQIAETLARDLGIRHGPFKLDIVVTRDGVRVIEATTRFSGGWDCQYLVPAATGKNILRAGILTAVGAQAGDSLRPRWDRVALSQSLWPDPGVIADIQGVDEARKIKGVEHIIFRKGIGHTIEPYVDCGKRVCFIITSGETEQEAQEAMDRAKEKIRIVRVT